MRSVVSPEIGADLLMTRDTVDAETPASFATSRMVADMVRPPSRIYATVCISGRKAPFFPPEDNGVSPEIQRKKVMQPCAFSCYHRGKRASTLLHECCTRPKRFGSSANFSAVFYGNPPSPGYAKRQSHGIHGSAAFMCCDILFL